jgi:uncharacterized protein
VIWNIIIDYLKGVAELFIEMTPYIILGMTMAGVLYVFISKGFVARHIGGHSFSAVVKAALFGVPLPLCSCGVLPTSVYLKDSGASRPAVLSFLIATPQTGVDSIVATYGMLGPFFAIFKAVSALVLGVFGGAVGIFTEKDHETDNAVVHESGVINKEYGNIRERVSAMINYAYIEFVDSIGGRFVIGLLIAGFISFLVPDNFFAGSRLSSGLPGMLLMIAVGTPLYVCSTSSLPIAVALVAKGFSPGAAFVFLVAGPATNAATIAVLSRVLGKKTTAVYLGTIIAGAVGMGYLLNILLLRWQGLTPALFTESIENVYSSVFDGGWIQYVLPAVFLALLLFSFLKKWGVIKTGRSKDEHSPENNRFKELDMGSLDIGITGMTCEHCVENVRTSISRLDGVTKVSVNLKRERAEIEGEVSLEDIQSAVEAVGYRVKG